MSTRFDSALEARAAEALAPHGIVRADGLLSQTFFDSNGSPFRARADFCHQATGMLFELKDSFLNEATSQATANNKRRVWLGTNEHYRQIRCDWNHSASKLATVQEGVAATGGALVALFWNEPDAETVARLNRRGAFWLVYGSLGWRNLLAFLRLKSHGLAVTLTFGANGTPAHEFD